MVPRAAIAGQPANAHAHAQAADRIPAAAAPQPAVGTKLAWPVGRSPQLLWTGFRTKHEGGEVLIQTSTEVELAAQPVTTKDGTVFVFKGCHASRRTDRLPLETRYFDSPVTRVSLKQHAGNLEVAVSLRKPVTPIARKEAGPGGSWFWVIEFPAPGETQPTTAAAIP
jgi:hypothetical protein